MKLLKYPHLLVSSALMLASPHVILAQAPAAAPVKEDQEVTLTFSKQTYTRGMVTQGKTVLINSYYLPKQTPTTWTHKVSMYVYPGIHDAAQYVNNMKANLAKEGVSAEIIPIKDPKLSGISYYEKNERMIKFNTFVYYPAKNGKALLARHFTLRAKPEKEEPFRKLVTLSKKHWNQELMAANYPGFKFPPQQGGPASPKAEPKKLPPLRTIEEKVDNITGKGKLVNVDASFAKSKGSDKIIAAPFSVTLPTTEHVMIMGHPQVPETVRFTLTNADKEYLQSVRFTSLAVDPTAPMNARVHRAVTLLEKQMVPKFFQGYQDAKIIGRYQTKVGPYHAGIIVTQMAHQDGRKFFVKFAGILQEGKAEGAAAVLMLNGSAGEPNSLKDRLRNGFAQQVMHSIRFAK
ncbi:hypothetical protein JIN77_10995 [Verrucomicrobiaceae bacterium R5-34]|uniref:Uncharacterized protein n=1 Tax=Oceaniferula flava TaxID=2800421 RepID=A0AAE2SC18_9BACT|nr:hypothetical protein [Oceaniferula flavus]MBK1831256.1 hypothetical protein [Verrucomicrobiaceae bacterium R5-34]MBK1855425.1 hypothetical protein [Oceaniferula flavus]MBM1136731.1 hypothetical protein [Oceaniferula flavus]